MAGEYRKETKRSGHTTGELTALVAPVLNLSAEDIENVVLVAFRTDGTLRMTGTMCGDCIPDALITALIVNEMAES